jgi:hypothetical protein
MVPRLARLTFDALALLSALLLITVAWLWSRGPDAGIESRRFVAWSNGLNVTAGILTHGPTKTADDWEWQAGDLSISKGRGQLGNIIGTFCLVQLPNSQAATALAVLPAAWVAWRVLRQRRTKSNGFDVLRPDPRR